MISALAPEYTMLRHLQIWFRFHNRYWNRSQSGISYWTEPEYIFLIETAVSALNCCSTRYFRFVKDLYQISCQNNESVQIRTSERLRGNHYGKTRGWEITDPLGWRKDPKHRSFIIPAGNYDFHFTNFGLPRPPPHSAWLWSSSPETRTIALLGSNSGNNLSKPA